MPNFCDVVKRIFDGWTVLQLAVEHGFGGVDSMAKAAWLVTAVEQWFSENVGLESYEVEDFLASILDTEFNTVADDGSLQQISRVLCECHQLISRGDIAAVERCLSTLPQASASKQCVQQANESTEVDDDNDDDEEMETDDTCTQCGPSSSTEQQNNQQNSLESSPPAEPKSQIKDDEQEDGWTVVTRVKKK